MIPKEVYDFEKNELIMWLRNEAGSSNPDYFHAKKTGGLKLQQVPEEFAELLLLLKSRNIKTYIELGIGNGGSFETICFFMKETLKGCIAVDNLAYGKLINQTEEEILERVEMVKGYLAKDSMVEFEKLTTDAFFHEFDITDKIDCAFIDADHNYEPAKRDYENALRYVKKGGLIIFHDINSQACPGIMKLWKEVRHQRRSWQFISSQTCGIGVIEI